MILDLVMKNIISNEESSLNELNRSNKYNNPKNSNQNSSFEPIKKFESLNKDFNTIRELLSNFQKMNERECKMRINEFVVGFEQNMQVLMSLANLFEQKTIFEIEKQRNSIMQILNSETIEPVTKLEVVEQKLEKLTEMIYETFEGIKDKVKAYEDISDKKIKRAKNSFLIKIKKFLE